jgi:hypothetical protein
VILGPARQGGLDEVRARPAHLRLDALRDALEVALGILGAYRRLVQLALHQTCTDQLIKKNVNPALNSSRVIRDVLNRFRV